MPKPTLHCGSAQASGQTSTPARAGHFHPQARARAPANSPGSAVPRLSPTRPSSPAPRGSLPACLPSVTASSLGSLGVLRLRQNLGPIPRTPFLCRGLPQPSRGPPQPAVPPAPQLLLVSPIQAGVGGDSPEGRAAGVRKVLTSSPRAPARRYWNAARSGLRRMFFVPAWAARANRLVPHDWHPQRVVA